MAIAIILYLFIGVLFNIKGPVIRIVLNSINDSKCFWLNNSTEKRNMKIRIISAEIFLRILILVIFPIAYIIWLYDFKKETDEKHLKKLRIKEFENLHKKENDQLIRIIVYIVSPEGIVLYNGKNTQCNYYIFHY